MKHIVITEFMDEGAIADLRRDFDVHYGPELADKSAELQQRVTAADGLIVRNRTQVDDALVQRAERLRVVGRLGVGLDNIDVAACRRRGIAVCPASGANDDAVAEYVIAAALILLRGCYTASSAVMEGRWPRQHCIGHELQGKRLGLVGLGGIARETAKRALALGMRVLAHDPYVERHDPAWNQVQYRELQALFTDSDVVSVHVPLDDGTRGLIDARLLSAMRAGAVLINTARGGIVDEHALVEALRAGRLGGAALDVYQSEPLSSECGNRFRDAPNLLLTPHVAGVTVESNLRVSAVTAANVRRVLESA